MMATIRTRKFMLTLLAALLAFAGYTVFGDRGLRELARLHRYRGALQDEVRSLEKENVRLGREINSLRDDPAAVEKLARTRLNMVKPGEVVYVFQDPSQGDTP